MCCVNVATRVDESGICRENPWESQRFQSRKCVNRMPGKAMKQMVSPATWSLCLILCNDLLVGAENPLPTGPIQPLETTQTGASTSRLGLSSMPSASEISAARVFDQPLLPSRETTVADNQALADALESFARRIVRDDFSALREFLDTHPLSAWSLALEKQLGHEYYRVGRYSKAIAAWEHAWESGKSADSEVSTVLANSAGSELAMMYARLGRITELRPLLAELDSRPMRGQNSRHIRGASDGLWSMEHQPEVSFRCGPLALDRICFATDRTKAGNQLIQDSQSTTNGFSATQVADLSRRTRDGNLLRAEDPTFGNYKIWLSDDALDDEASGYFLVRSGELPAGWRGVSDSEANRVWGKGTTHKSDEDATTPDDEQTCKPSSPGMAQWNVHLLLASHHVEDTPVGYTPPVGPPIYINASYNSINGWPAYGLPYSNISQEWRLNWLAYVTDDPMNPAGDVRFAANGGGTLTFTDFNPTNQVFRNLFRNRAYLVRTGTNSYEIRYPDGSKKIFDQPDSSVGTTRKVFMSAVVDAAGNAATIQFDQPGRIASITDAIGQKTQFFYEMPTTNVAPTLRWVPPYILTRVVDPFGRTATFDYGGYAINARLISITDAIRLTSSFRYDYNPGQPDLGMTNLITPYGTTIFQRGTHNGLYRANWVEITHPNGEKERVEYSEKTPAQVFSSEPLSIVPKGVPVRNFILWARNTYHWDRKAYAEGYSPNDYSKARIYHWTHGQDYNTASPILESFKEPLEHRVWFNYDGQVNPTFVGTSDQPTKIARTTEDGTTQLYQYEYNSLNNPTKAIDPLGREITFSYDTNEVDLLEVRQTRAGQNELLFSATYNSEHRPLTLTDAARQTNTFTYNARGQVLTATNPRQDTTTFFYDSNGYLQTVDGPLPGTNDTSGFTYDTVGRLRTASDVDGYTLTFDYDAIDRLTRITYPDTTYEEITYNRLDPEVVRDRAGRETRLTYDSLRQLVAVEDPLGRVTRYNWCGCGGLDAMIDPLGQATSWIRDVQGRVKTKVYADGSQIRYDYDTATGWLKFVRDEQNQVMKFDYNSDGSLRQKSFLNALISTPAVKLTYDPNYPRLLTREDGTGLTTYGYHPITGSSSLGAGRLASIDERTGANSIAYHFDYDAADQLTNGVGTQNGSAVASYAYGYDGSQNLTNESANGILRAFSYNALNELTSIANDSRPPRTYEWDAENRLVAFNQGTHRTDFTYDGLDRRSRIVEKENGFVVSDRRYVWCGTELCEERDATGANVLKRFSNHGVDAQTGSDLPEGNYFFTRDHLRSVRDMTDRNGSVRGQYGYSPVGVRQQLGGDLHADLGFTGHYFHGPSDLHLSLFRAYDASLGRWISRDPLGEAGGQNLYSYVEQDPINWRDPLGLTIYFETQEGLDAYKTALRQAPAKYAVELVLLDLDQSVIIHVQHGQKNLSGFQDSAGAFSVPHDEYPLLCSGKGKRRHGEQETLKNWDVYYNNEMLQHEKLSLDVALLHELSGHINRAQDPKVNWTEEAPARQIHNEYLKSLGRPSYP